MRSYKSQYQFFVNLPDSNTTNIVKNILMLLNVRPDYHSEKYWFTNLRTMFSLSASFG